MMKKTALGLALGLLVGCATQNEPSVTPLQQPVAVYQTLNELDYTPLNIHDDSIKQVRQLTMNSAVVKLNSSQSSVLGWKIPAYGVYRFKLSSDIKRTKFGREASAFMAEVRLLDQNFNVVKTLPAESLSYQKPGLMKGEYFYHSFVVDNRDPLQLPAQYMVVVMTEAGRQHKIMVVDQEKEYAKALTADIMATADENGTITLEAVAVNSTYTTRDTLFTSDAPLVSSGPTDLTANDEVFDTAGISRTYRKEVQRLLQAGEVMKALGMRRHVDALQVGLQKDFADLYKNGGGSRLIDNTSLSTLSPEEQLVMVYKNQLRTYLNSGNTRQALGLLDQTKTLKEYIDALF